MLTLDSFSSESVQQWVSSLPSSILFSFLPSKELDRARQKDFSCSFIVERLGKRFPQYWQAENFKFRIEIRWLELISQSQKRSMELTEGLFSRVNSLVSHDVRSLDEGFVAKSKDPF